MKLNDVKSNLGVQLNTLFTPKIKTANLSFC